MFFDILSLVCYQYLQIGGVGRLTRVSQSLRQILIQNKILWRLSGKYCAHDLFLTEIRRLYWRHCIEYGNQNTDLCKSPPQYIRRVCETCACDSQTHICLLLKQQINTMLEKRLKPYTVDQITKNMQFTRFPNTRRKFYRLCHVELKMCKCDEIHSLSRIHTVKKS